MLKYFSAVFIAIFCFSNLFSQLQEEISFVSPKVDTVAEARLFGLNFFFLSDSTFLTSNYDNSFREHGFASQFLLGDFSIKGDSVFLRPPKDRAFVLWTAYITKSFHDSITDSSNTKLSCQIMYLDINSGHEYIEFLNDADYDFLSSVWNPSTLSFRLSEQRLVKFKIPRISNHVFVFELDPSISEVLIECDVSMKEPFLYTKVISKSELKN